MAFPHQWGRIFPTYRLNGQPSAHLEWHQASTWPDCRRHRLRVPPSQPLVGTLTPAHLSPSWEQQALPQVCQAVSRLEASQFLSTPMLQAQPAPPLQVPVLLTSPQATHLPPAREQAQLLRREQLASLLRSPSRSMTLALQAWCWH